MDLTIKDVATLLDVSESTINRWLSEGKIPSYRINQQYFFNRSEVEDWVINQKPVELAGKEKEHSSAPAGTKQFSLYRAIHRGQVLVDVPGDTKEEVIKEAVKRIAVDLNLDAEVISELLLDREKLQPTALNNGIGIPHTRDFLLSAHYDVVTVVFPKKPLEYGALDGLPVNALFFLFACNDKKHLHLLAKIAHLSSQEGALKLLKTKPGKDHLLDYVKTWEASIHHAKEGEE